VPEERLAYALPANRSELMHPESVYAFILISRVHIAGPWETLLALPNDVRVSGRVIESMRHSYRRFTFSCVVGERGWDARYLAQARQRITFRGMLR
jgi:hypothetical protein